MASNQIELLGTFSDEVKKTVTRIGDERFIERLWEKDPTLWSVDTKTHAAILNRLGWLTVVPEMAGRVAQLSELLKAVQEEGITHGVLLGMGGSSLFAEVCRNVFETKEGGLDMAILDTTDPTAIRQAIGRAPLKKTLALVASKSGTTAETSALTKYFDALFREDPEIQEPGKHAVAVSDKDTVLETHAKQSNYRAAFVLDKQLGSDVGGRFSALTYFGLVPAALMGIDAGRLVGEGLSMLDACGPNAALDENPAVQLAALIGALGAQGRNKLTFLSSPELSTFGLWVEQLIAESTGKNGKGILPVVSEPVRDAADYAEDRVFIELQLAACPDDALHAHAQALSNAGHPVMRIEWKDRYNLGGEVVKWSVATALIGALQGENPFDEPNVTEAKAATKHLLERFAAEHKLPEQQPLVDSEDLSVYGSAAMFKGKQIRSAVDALEIFFGSIGKDDYIGILNFMPRTEDLDAAAQSISKVLVERLSVAVSLQFGPRYLHSTGQLHKGGHNTGVFLELTADSPEDFAIPGEPFSFDVLKQAQALGDWQALCDRGRRVLRLHLKGDLSSAACRMQALIEETFIKQLT